MRNFRFSLLAGAVALAAAPALAVNPAQVNLDGSAGFASINDALLAVDDGGVVEVIEAGTYAETVELGNAGGKTVTLRNTSGGQVLLTLPESGGIFTTDPDLNGAIDITIEGIDALRGFGTGTVFDIDQSTTVANTINIVANNCTFRHELDPGAAVDDGGEALKFDDGFAGGAQVTFTANNCVFFNDAPDGEFKAAIRVQDSTWENLSITLVDCTVESEDHRAIRLSSGGPGLSLSMENTQVLAVNERAIVWDSGANGFQLTMSGGGITSGEESFYTSGTATNADFFIERAILDGSGAANDNAARLRFTDGGGNILRFYNNVIISSEGRRALDLEGWNDGLYVYNNTFVGSGAGGAEGIGGSGVSANAWNNLFLNFNDDNLMSGSFDDSVNVPPTYDSDNNIIVGPFDDGSKGGNGVYVFATAGLVNAVFSAGVDADYKPEAGSPAIGAGAAINTATNPFNDILAELGNVDLEGNPRTDPPTVGAYAAPGASVSDWRQFSH